MGRRAEPGISYYSMNCGHTRNKKIRLLINDCGSDGYWVWQCILDEAYETKGYYFDYNDTDELEIFASDKCKQTLELVKKVIDCCLRRGLFDKRLYDECKILTSKRMQKIYLEATAERRRKGTEIELIGDILLIDLPESARNISIVPWNKQIVPRNNSINPGTIPPQNPQSKVEESTVKESKVNNPTGGVPAVPPPGKRVVKKKREEAEPFWQSLIKVWFDFNIEKFGGEPSFDKDNPRIFKRIIQRLKNRAAKQNVEWNLVTGPQRLRFFLDSAYGYDDWLPKHFTLANLEKQFDPVILQQKKASKKNQDSAKSDLQYLYERFLDGELDIRLILPEHYSSLVVKGIFSELFFKKFIPARIKQLTGTNQAVELRLLDAYQKNDVTKETEMDKAILMRMSIIYFFNQLKENKKQHVYANEGMERKESAAA